MYTYHLTPRADTQLKRLARRNPEATVAIIRKMRWLAEHAEEIEHQPLAGTPFFVCTARHFVSRICWKANRRIIVDDIGQHDAAYNRVNRMK